MKKYIFLTLTIGSIGGVQQYLYNKTKYLKANGYKVFIVSGLSRKIYIKLLQEFENTIIPNIMYSPNCFKDREQNKVLLKIIHELEYSENDEFFIETHGIAESEWGDLLAQRLMCKSIYFEMSEAYDFSLSEQAYIKHKIKQREFVLISENKLENMLGNIKDVFNLDNNLLRAKVACNNVVDDIAYCNDIKTYNVFSFATIGRLEKPCMPFILKNVLSYCKANPTKQFVYFLIGGTDETIIVKRIIKEVKNVSNLELKILGYTYPIPLKLIESIDLFLSTAGSAFVSYREKRPTIMFNPVTGDIAGLIGYDFIIGKNNMFTSKSTHMFSELVDIVQKQPKRIDFVNDCLDFDYDTEFDREIAYFSNGMVPNYYDISQIKAKGKKQLLYKVVGHLTNGDIMQFLAEKYRKFFFGLTTN